MRPACPLRRGGRVRVRGRDPGQPGPGVPGHQCLPGQHAPVHVQPPVPGHVPDGRHCHPSSHSAPFFPWRCTHGSAATPATTAPPTRGHGGPWQPMTRILNGAYPIHPFSCADAPAAKLTRKRSLVQIQYRPRKVAGQRPVSGYGNRPQDHLSPVCHQDVPRPGDTNRSFATPSDLALRYPPGPSPQGISGVR